MIALHSKFVNMSLNTTGKYKFFLDFKVHEEMKKVKDKVEGAIYPTTTALHEAIMSIPGMPKWGKTTTYNCLRNMGFS